MIKRDENIGERYREVLTEREIDWDLISVIGFKFESASYMHAFHYSLMLHKVPYLMYDGYENGKVHVLFLKNEETAERLCNEAEMFKGKRIKVNLKAYETVE